MGGRQRVGDGATGHVRHIEIDEHDVEPTTDDAGEFARRGSVSTTVSWLCNMRAIARATSGRSSTTKILAIATFCG